MVCIDNEKCVRCGLCAENCWGHAISEKDGALQCSKLWCFRCGQCVAICPAGAVSMPELPEPVEYDKETFHISPENLLNTMRFRRSIRCFTGEKVPRSEIETLLEAGRCAPSSSNSQTVAYTVLDRDFDLLRPMIWESLARLSRENGQELLLRRYNQYLAHPDQPDTLFYGGTQMISVTSRRPIDGALAMANMELLAHTMGIGALYCRFAAEAIQADEELRRYFGIQGDRKLDGCLIIGRTERKFYRTAPRNPAQVEWK